jgi:hypothetical protein
MVLFAGICVMTLGASTTLFEGPRKVLFHVANLKPISTAINSLQSWGIPANNAACLKDLETQDVDIEVVSDFSTPEGCLASHAVRLTRAGKVKIDNAPLLTCRMASQLAEFEAGPLQTSARRLLGTEVRRIKHFGTYNCRGMRHLNNILSQHAFANAIDVSGFKMANGQSISVLRDWKPPGPRSAFLKEVALAACDTFRVSVSPDGDANHRDHFHWDMGLYSGCR